MKQFIAIFYIAFSFTSLPCANAFDSKSIEPKTAEVISFDSDKILVLYQQKRYYISRSEFSQIDLRQNLQLTIEREKKAWDRLK